MTEERLVELMEDNFKKFGWNTWKNKSSILFKLKAKYGSTFDEAAAGKVYDKIYKREHDKLEEEGW